MNPLSLAAGVVSLLAFQGAKAPSAPEIRIEFFVAGSSAEDIEFEVEAWATPKATASQPSPKPRRVTRIFTWSSGGTDFHELAGLAGEAFTSAGIDAVAQETALVLRGASEATVRTKGWSALGAQVVARVPSAGTPAGLSFSVLPAGTVGAGTLVVSAGDSAAGPKAPEAPAVAAPKPADPKAKPAAPKPADPKAKAPPKPTELKIPVAAKSEWLAMREALTKACTDAGWKADSTPSGLFSVAAGANGEKPRWVAARYTGAGDVKVGVKILEEPKK